MKRNAIARIVIYSVLALVLTGILVAVLAFDGFMLPLGSSGGTAVEGEVSLDAAEIHSLRIEWAAGSVQILAADTDRITVSEVRPNDSKYPMTYQISGNTLKLDYGVKSISFGMNQMQKKDLLVVVPLDWVCQELEIDGASLDITITDLTVGTLKLDGASCDLDFSGSVDEVSIDGASTDATLRCGNRVDSIDVDGASCSLEVFLPKDCGFLVEMDGLSCDFHSDLSGVSQGGDYSYGDRHCKIDVDGISCDVTVKENTVWPIDE